MRVALLVLCACLAAAPAALPRHGLLGIVVDEKSGAVYAQRVLPLSAAAQADVRDGDVITAVDGAPVSTVAQFLKRVHRPGGTALVLSIRRGDTALSKTVVMHTAPNDAAPGVNFTYDAVEIDGTLRRTVLTAPADARGPLPGVFLAGGIGCFTVDTTDPQDGYRNVAIDLARAGFVVLRLEKSGVGDSQGPPCSTVDFQTEYHSYEVALASFAANPAVDRKHLYVLGHSIGTVDAPRLAASVPLAGIVVSEAVGENWFEYELQNVQRQAILAGRTPAEVDEEVATKELCMHRLLIEKQAPDKILADRPDCKDSISYPAPPEYLQQVAALNIAAPWTKVDVPVLAVYGGADFVTTRPDAERIVSIVNASRPGTASLAIVPNMDHNLQVAASPQEFMQHFLKGTPTVYNRAFSDTVLAWLCRRERCIGRSSSESTQLPLTITDNRILVPALVNGKGPFSLILDTGDGGNVVITPDVARAAGLQAGAAGTEYGAGETAVRTRRAMLHSLQVGSLNFDSLDASVIDLSQIRTHLGFSRLDGVVGYSVLKDLRVRVDRQNQTLTLSRTPLAAPPGATAVTFTLSGNLLQVPARLDGRQALVIVDTGDRSSVTVFNAFAARHGFYNRYPSVKHVVTGFGIGGPIYADVFTLPRIDVLGLTFHNVRARASRQKSGAFATATQDGSIGGGILNRVNVIYDYPSRQMLVWPPTIAGRADGRRSPGRPTVDGVGAWRRFARAAHIVQQH